MKADLIQRVVLQPAEELGNDDAAGAFEGQNGRPKADVPLGRALNVEGTSLAVFSTNPE
jgi:hypothetical protein